VFKQPNYLENFVQATFNALTAEKVKGEIFFILILASQRYLLIRKIHECLLFICAGATLVVSGDGRYYSKDAVQVRPMIFPVFWICVNVIGVSIEL